MSVGVRMSGAGDDTAGRRGPAYRIETERLLIRCWTPEDARPLRAILDERGQHLRPWIPWMRDEPQPLAATMARLRKYRANFDQDLDYRYAVVDPQDGALVGETGLYTRVGADAREIGYWTDARCASRGYAAETTAAMVRVAFEIDGVDRVEIHCAPENTASAAIPRRLGFTHEATLARRFRDTDDRWRASMIWTLFRSDYDASPVRLAPVRAYDGQGERLL